MSVIVQGGKSRILIADDEFQIRELLCDLLRPNYECVGVNSAEQALALLRAERFDLILSDISMGGLSGLEMVPHVLRIAPETVVIMISGGQNIESAVEALRVGAFDYITKPFDLRHVEAAVRRALEHHALRESKRRYENDLEELIKQRTAQVDHLSYHDALTGLPNRILFEDRVAQAILSAQRNKQLLAVMLLDLDRFQTTNDTLGPMVGDRVLCDVAERLGLCVRAGDSIARLGSDEFALLLTQLETTKEAETLNQKIVAAFQHPFLCGTHELYLTASKGISFYPLDGTDTHSLLKNAGAALCQAKEQGGDEYQIYTAEMNAGSLKRLTMENRLRRALERDEFIVHYQPQADADTRKITGVEALVRWQHPDLGLVSPAEFIPLAEETGLMVPLGEWVLRIACAQNKAWQQAGFTKLSMSVNLSLRQFRQTNLTGMVEQVIRETGLDPTCLELELTESSVMMNTESAVTTLSKLQALGIRIAIDDFGTGYSSLNYLKNLPIDTLKIDRSFVRDAATNPVDAAIIQAIITLAHSLNLKVKAEGIETQEQLDFLRRLKCDEIQGYLLSRPLPAEALEQLLVEEQKSSMTRTISRSVQGASTSRLGMSVLPHRELFC
ncbi:MAG TPA: EAL domain-containing protein [Pyrinomonadaceae bacterium]